MKVQLLIPSQENKRFFVDTTKDETVLCFRKRVAELLDMDKKDFLLISLGKILNDKCADKSLALLTSTYRVRDKTSIIVHVNKRYQDFKSSTTVVREENKQRKKNVVLSLEVVTKPFEEFFCNTCENKNKKCSECGCRQCLLKTGDPIICDQCDTYWHAQCAGLTKIPKDKYWYCPDCINTDVDLIVDKKKKIQNTKSLDALMRMREKECAIVPRNHVGKIPGVYCGQTWENLNACSDWGIHRTTSFSSRVLGGSDTGAVSIFLYRNSRNFKTYEDKGYEFIFSGLGVISKVTSSLMDKSLVRQDLSLALTCDAPLNSKTGSKAVNWKRSRPIRVCRAHVEKFMSEFDPVEGVRYDGIYKVVEYWPVTCQNPKRVVWKFKLRRDDDELAPWLVQSKNLSIERGLRMIYEDEDKAKKIVQYKIPPHIIQMMDEDTANKRKWDEVKKLEFWSEFEFINYLFDTVIVCNSGACSKPIQNPIVTSCGHICCKKCLTYSKSDTCFTCRSPINKGRMVSNVALIGILKVFSPTYGQDTEKIPCPAMRYDPPKRKRDGSIDLKKRKKIRIVIDSV